MERESWLGLGCFLCVESHGEEVSTGRRSVKKRYYLSSRKPYPKALQKKVRRHWAIENSCHWLLDVVWNEDASRIRKGNAAENVALLRKIALNVLKSETSVKDTIRGKRLRAALSEEVLGQFLGLKVR